MLVETMIEAATVEFKQKFTKFCENEPMDRLTPAFAERVADGMKWSLADAGIAGYRAFLLAFDVQQDVVAADGECFRFNAVREKRFLTPFGEMTLPRRCYQNKGDDKSFMPLDAAWGMEGQYMAPQVREAVLFSCGHVTPEETAQLLQKSALFTPHATAIKHVVQKTGVAIEANRDTLDQCIRAEETVPEQTHAMVTSLDGATVLLNEKGAVMGRPAERPRGGASEHAHSSAYRTAMVGSISYYAAPEDEHLAPERLQSRYTAHMPEEQWPTFKALIETELQQAEEQCPENAARILLLDGARALWNYVEQQPLFADYHKLIDFWHTAEHLSLAAEALFGKGSEEAKKWYAKYRTRLLQSDCGGNQIQRSMDYYEKRHRLSPARKKALEVQRTFFRRNAHRMEYATFQERGWPIGSGPVEAACKTLVKARLCRSGMRWTRRGGQHILALRTYIKSNRWDAAWQHIKEFKPAA